MLVICLRRSRRGQEEYAEEKDYSPNMIIEPFISDVPAARQPELSEGSSSPPPASSTDDWQPSAIRHEKLSPSSDSSYPYPLSTQPPSSTEPEAMREVQDRLHDMQARLDALQDTRSVGSSSRLQDEITSLREQVARLEVQRHSLWSAIGDPPPEYIRGEGHRATSEDHGQSQESSSQSV